MRKSISIRILSAITLLALAGQSRAELIFTPIGDLTGGAFASIAQGISDDGDVVVGGSISTMGREAFRWTRGGGIAGLGDLPDGDVGSIATAVSGDGNFVVGVANDHDGGMRVGDIYLDVGLSPLDDGVGFTIGGSLPNYPVRAERGFRWESRTGMVSLGTLPTGSQSVAFDVSDEGDSIVGVADNGYPARAVRWDGGVIAFEPGTAINNAWVSSCDSGGDVVAGTIISGSLESLFSGFVTSEGNGVLLDSPVENGSTVGWGCSPCGRFVCGAGGISKVGNVVTSVAMIWKVPLDLSTAPDPKGIIVGENLVNLSGDSAAAAISADREVIGGAGERLGELCAFISTGGSDDAQWLDDFLAARGASVAGWTFTSVTAVSRDGNSIAGYGVNPQGSTEGFVIKGIIPGFDSPAKETLSISAVGGQLILRWTSSSDERYRVQRYSRSSENWENVSSFINGTGGGLSFSQTMGSDAAMYRLEIGER